MARGYCIRIAIKRLTSVADAAVLNAPQCIITSHSSKFSSVQLHSLNHSAGVLVGTMQAKQCVHRCSKKLSAHTLQSKQCVHSCSKELSASSRRGTSSCRWCRFMASITSQASRGRTLDDVAALFSCLMASLTKDSILAKSLCSTSTMLACKGSQVKPMTCKKHSQALSIWVLHNACTR